MRWKAGVFLAAACVLAPAVLSCGGNSTSPSNPAPGTPGSGTGGPTTSTCRTYPTAATVTTTAGGVTQNALLTGAYNAATNQATITVSFTNGSLCSTAVHQWRSTADFVDEVRVVPPVPLNTSTTTTNSGSCGTGTGTATLAYDSSRRLVSVTTTGAGVSGTTTYTAWDSSGRPTLGQMSGGGTITNVYNDSARTVTSSQIGTTGAVTNSVMTYDANGAQVSIVVTTSGVTSSTTYTNTSTAQVCK